MKPVTVEMVSVSRVYRWRENLVVDLKNNGIIRLHKLHAFQHGTFC
jgi:hypothetical protein